MRSVVVVVVVVNFGFRKTNIDGVYIIEPKIFSCIYKLDR